MSGRTADYLPRHSDVAGYRVISVISAGGFGILYRAEATGRAAGTVTRRLGTDRAPTLGPHGPVVALKEFFPLQLARREGLSVVFEGDVNRAIYDLALQKFVTESQRLINDFDHPNIVRGIALLPCNNTYYFAMEFLQGETLTAWLGQRERETGLKPAEEDLRPLMEPLLDALKLVHDNEQMHRDIKPDNIMVDVTGRPLLIDFGLIGEGLNRARQGTLQALTPGYAPPEQLGIHGTMIDSVYVDLTRQGSYSDIYALGAVLLRSITGRSPPDADHRLRMTAAGQADPILPMLAALPKGRYGETFLSGLRECMDLNPSRRPQSAEEVAQRLGWRGTLFSRPRRTKSSQRDDDATLPLALSTKAAAGIAPDPDAPAAAFKGATTGTRIASDGGRAAGRDEATQPTRGGAVEGTPLPQPPASLDSPGERRRRRWPALAALLVLAVPAGVLGYPWLIDLVKVSPEGTPPRQDENEPVSPASGSEVERPRPVGERIADAGPAASPSATRVGSAPEPDRQESPAVSEADARPASQIEPPSADGIGAEAPADGELASPTPADGPPVPVPSAEPARPEAQSGGAVPEPAPPLPDGAPGEPERVAADELESSTPGLSGISVEQVPSRQPGGEQAEQGKDVPAPDISAGSAPREDGVEAPPSAVFTTVETAGGPPVARPEAPAGANVQPDSLLEADSEADDAGALAGAPARPEPAPETGIASAERPDVSPSHPSGQEAREVASLPSPGGASLTLGGEDRPRPPEPDGGASPTRVPSSGEAPVEGSTPSTLESSDDPALASARAALQEEIFDWADVAREPTGLVLSGQAPDHLLREAAQEAVRAAVAASGVPLNDRTSLAARNALVQDRLAEAAREGGITSPRAMLRDGGRIVVTGFAPTAEVAERSRRRVLDLAGAESAQLAAGPLFVVDSTAAPPAARRDSAEPATLCDDLALPPDHPLRPAGTSGTSFERIKPDRAMAACAIAHRLRPREPRFALAAGLAALKADEQAKARMLIDAAAEAGEPYARAYRAWLDVQARPSDDAVLARAMEDQRAAASAGVGSSALLLARLQESDSANRATDPLPVWRSAAAAGVPAAMSALGVLAREASDPLQAAGWFEMAGEYGSAAALDELAALLESAPELKDRRGEADEIRGRAARRLIELYRSDDPAIVQAVGEGLTNWSQPLRTALKRELEAEGATLVDGPEVDEEVRMALEDRRANRGQGQ